MVDALTFADSLPSSSIQIWGANPVEEAANFRKKGKLRKDAVRRAQNYCEAEWLQQRSHEAELDSLRNMLTTYEEHLAAGQALDFEQKEKIQSLRRAFDEELESAKIREAYIHDLHIDYARLEKLEQASKQRERKLVGELEYMKQRVQMLEYELDRLIERSHVTDSLYHHMFREEIHEWKKLRDLMVRLEPKKAFWETVHTFGSFMERTLRLADEAVRISRECALRTEHTGFGQIMQQPGPGESGHPLFTRTVHTQPNPISAFYQLPCDKSESDSDSSGDSNAGEGLDFEFWHSPNSSPNPPNTPFESLDKFFEKDRGWQPCQYTKHDTDEIADNYGVNWHPVTEESYASSRCLWPGSMENVNMNRPGVVYDRVRGDDSTSNKMVGSQGSHRTTSSEGHPHLQGFQPREYVSEEAIVFESNPVFEATTVPRKRANAERPTDSILLTNLAKIEANKSLINMSQGSTGAATPTSPYTRPDMRLSDPLVHRYLHRGSQQCEDPLKLRSAKLRGHFPERVSKAARVRSRDSGRHSRRSSPQPSSSLSTLAAKELARLVNILPSTPSTFIRNLAPGEYRAVEHSLAEWIWIYCKQRPRTLIRPLLGLAVFAAVLYVVRDMRLYQRFVDSNMPADRMMYRMRQAQADFRPVDAYMHRGWERWLDVDRVALQ